MTFGFVGGYADYFDPRIGEDGNCAAVPEGGEVA